MSKFRIEHGASKVNLVLLKTNIEDTISNDIDLMAQWSNNDRKFVVNELLRFALTQEEDFLKYKTSSAGHAARPASGTRSVPSAIKPAANSVSKPEPSPSATTHA
jgi:hypothetical protein